MNEAITMPAKYAALLITSDGQYESAVCVSDNLRETKRQWGVYFRGQKCAFARHAATLATAGEAVSANTISRRRDDALQGKRLHEDDAVTLYGDDGVELWGTLPSDRAE